MPIGFIKSPLEIMELILYIMARVDGAIDMGPPRGAATDRPRKKSCPTLCVSNATAT